MLTAPNKALVSSLAAVAGALGSALCCAGPLVAVALGMSGAGLAPTFAPWRPYFVAGTVMSLVYGFVTLHREDKRACEPDGVCASPNARRRMKRLLWMATAVALPLLSFSWWSPFIID